VVFDKIALDDKLSSQAKMAFFATTLRHQLSRDTPYAWFQFDNANPNVSPGRLENKLTQGIACYFWNISKVQSVTDQR
jgi:hypothetical protein